MRVAAIQMTSTPNKSANLAEAHRLLREAMAKEPHLVAFPEMFSLITGHTRQLLDEAELLSGVTVDTLREWAIEYGVWILGGSVFLKSSARAKRVTNTSLLITPEGEIAARYDKIHLFDARIRGEKAYLESKTVQPGKKVVSVKTPFGVLGLSVCYDLRFPELYRELSKQGASVVFIPSAFTAFSGQAHWDVLTRARAIENQVYVVAPAQTGTAYPGRETYGHARIIDPWGRVIAERTSGAGIVFAELDFGRLQEVRREMPVLQHRRLR